MPTEVKEEEAVPTTGARLHRSDCARYECACLAPWESIRNGDLVFKDNATGLVYPEWADWREWVGYSVSCVCNDTEECITIEYQKAHIDETEFAVPFDDPTFDPTGTQFFNFNAWYPTVVDSWTEAPTWAWMSAHLVWYYDSCPSECGEPVRYAILKKAYCC